MAINKRVFMAMFLKFFEACYGSCLPADLKLALKINQSVFSSASDFVVSLTKPARSSTLAERQFFFNTLANSDL